MDMLYRIFGKKEEQPNGKGLTTIRRGAGGKPLVLTPKAFDGMFGTGVSPKRGRRKDQ